MNNSCLLLCIKNENLCIARRDALINHGLGQAWPRSCGELPQATTCTQTITMTLSELTYTRMGEMPVQKQAGAENAQQERALFYNSATAFMKKLSVVPDQVFTVERDEVLSGQGRSRVVNCDISHVLNEATPCTTPHILARYALVKSKDDLTVPTAATGLIVYVIEGAGRCEQGTENVQWVQGDVVILPGGEDVVFSSASDHSILWIVGDEPLVAFQGLTPDPKLQTRRTEIVHFTAKDIDKQLQSLYSVEKEPSTAGRALIFSSEENISTRNILPTLTLAMNTLKEGETHRPHRHNSVAVTLIVDGDGCHSTVDGVDKEWSPFATTITPACSMHTHTNNGPRMARFLIVQDGGLYTHARTPGFSFD